MCHRVRLVATSATYLCLMFSGSIRAADDVAAASQVAERPSAMSNEQAIRQAMSEPISLDLQGVPLTEAIQSVAEKHHLEYLFDGGALKDAGIDPSTTLVTAAMKGVTLRSALKWMLAPFGLAATIKDEVLVITTKAKADSTFETRLYDVRDLVLHENDPGASPEFDSLMDAIRTTVSPANWDKAGGQGSIAAFSNNGVCALTVWQNAQGHEEIEKLLTELRSLKPRRVYNQ
jgi:hypothetical protein